MQGNVARGFVPRNIQYILSQRYFLPFKLQEKCLHSQKIYESLNIPQKPKKPATPFLKFVEQVRPTLTKEFPNIKATELMKVAGQRWSVVDVKLKEKIMKDYSEAYNIYKTMYTQYEQSLTPEQKKIIEEVQLHKSELKEDRELRKKSKALGKPKKPAGIFIKYLASKRSEQDKYPDKKDFVKAVTKEWKNVSSAVKDELENERKLEVEKFNHELKLWEEKMIKEGNLDIVRKVSVIPQPKAKLKK